MRLKTTVALCMLFLASLLGSFNLIPEAAADESFLVGTQLGDNWKKETYSDETIRLITPFPTYLKDGVWTEIDTTVIPSQDPNYDWAVETGRYQAYFRERVLFGGSGQNAHAVKFVVDENWLTFRPDALFYRDVSGPVEQIAGPADVMGIPSDDSFFYPGVFLGQDIDLRYEYGTAQLKELFILNTAPTPPANPTPTVALNFDLVFVYKPDTVPLNDGVPWNENDRIQSTNITFVNATTGKILYSLMKPFAIDANGDVIELLYELDRDPPRLKIRVVVPSAWLQSAAYPVLVDPSLTIQPSEIDSYVDEAVPDTNYGTVDSMYVESSDPGSVVRSHVQFNISTIPEDATITSATMELYKYATVGSFPRTYLASRITAYWVETVINWTNQPAVTATAEASATIESTSGFYSWDITTILTSWFDGTNPNYGVRVNDSDETVPATGPSSAFRSREATQTTERPKLTIAYTVGVIVPFDPAWLTISYFNGFGGLGLPFSTFSTRYENATGSHRVPFTPFPVNASQTINITTFDFLGNEINREDGFAIGAAGTYAIINIGINIAKVSLIFSDGRQHLHEFNDLDTGKTTLGYDTPTMLFADHNYSYEVFEDDQIEAVTETNLTDLVSSVHVFPVNVTLKDVEIRYSLYDAATGEGLPFTTFPIYADYVRLRTPFYFTRTGAEINTAVRDFFGNEIYNETQNASSAPYFWDIPITVFSWKLTNADLYDYVLSNLTYNGSGVGRAEFVGAGETIAYWLRSGDYTLNLTYYELAILTGSEEVFFTISSAQAYTVTGNRSIQRIIEGVGGVGDNILDVWNRVNQTWVRVGQLDTPAGIAIIYDTYYVPPMSILDLVSKDVAPGQTIDPFRTLIYDVVNTSQGTGRLLLYRPYEVGWDDDDVTLMRDELHLVVVSGSLTRLWLNDTQDTATTADDTIVLNITYTGFFDLTQYGDGLNLSLETTGTASVNATRVSQVRYVSTFLWSQDTTTREWTMTTNLENTISLRWTSVTIYIAFPQELDPDASTVVVRDVSAAIDLEKGIHYDLTDGGVYLALTEHASGASTTWRVTFFQRVVGTAITEPRCSFGQITTQRRGLVDMKRVDVVCVNENPFDYRGRLVIVFDLALAVDHADLIIEDNAGNVLPNTMYWNDPNTLIIVGVGLPSLSTLQLVVWFRYVADTFAITDILPFLPIMTLLFTAFTFISFWFWGKQPKGSDRRERARVATYAFIIGAVITFVLWIYLQISLRI